MTAQVRLGLLGGTFDPIHHGHLDAAMAARRALSLPRVLLVPSQVPPHRPVRPEASGYHRFAMTALAVDGVDGLVASDIELEETGLSYTARTLARLHESGYSPSQLFFITGADAFAEIATWRDYPALLDAAHFVVVSRPGFATTVLRDILPDLAARFRHIQSDGPAQDVAGPAIWLVEARTREISSTCIRDRRRRGLPLDDLVPPAVARHIERHGLYLTGDPGRLHEPAAATTPQRAPTAGRGSSLA